MNQTLNIVKFLLKFEQFWGNLTVERDTDLVAVFVRVGRIEIE